MQNLLLFVQLTRPLFLFGPAMGYALGVGIAQYLGYSVNWTAYFLGQAWVTFMQLSTQYLNEYFNAPADLMNTNRTYLSGGSGAIGPGKLTRRTAQLAALICLAFVASISALMFSMLSPGPEVYMILALAFLGSFLYSVPPVRLEASGYGELTTSVLVAFLVPMLGFVLQTGELHRLVAMAALPTFAAHWAMLLALELPDYANDEKFEKRNLLVRLGWQNGMLLHNALILIAFMLMFVALSSGFPLSPGLAGLASVPVGLFQLWQMRTIANGGRVNWPALTTGGVAFYAVMVYLLALAFWTT